MKNTKRTKHANLGFRTAVASEMRVPGSSERLVSRNGELNAGSKKELAQLVAKMMEVATDTHIVTESRAQEAAALATKHQELVTAAFNSREEHAALGETMADELFITMDRQALFNKFLARKELKQGQRPEVPLRKKNVVATVATSVAQVETRIVRDNYIFPQEFYVEARPFIEQRDISVSPTDVLQEKYLEALEGLMVGADRTYLELLMTATSLENGDTTIIGQMDPTALGTLRNKVARWGINPAGWLIANDLWTDIVADVGFQNIIDQVSKHELLLEGRLGTILGMEVVSDAFRHPEHKVLSAGQMFIIGDAGMHGVYTDRGGVEATPIDASHTGMPGRGWHMFMQLSMAVPNARSVAAATRTL